MTRTLSTAATAVVLTFGVLSVPAATAPPPADAPIQCAPRTDMVQALDDKFQESQTAQGVVNPDVVLEVFVSEQGTWTILATGTDGNSCVISAGEGWDSDVFAALPES